MTGWRAWHWDGDLVDVYSSSELRWQDLPRRGVVGVVVYLDPPYRRIIQGHDWVWLEDGALLSITTADEWGEWAPAPEVDCAACLKRGAGVPDEPWARIQSEMTGARECP